MKTKSLLVLPVLVFPFLLSSCSKNKANLTYGTYLEESLNTLNEISTEELHNRLFNKEETMLVAVYQGKYSESCLCWITFQNVIVSYMNTYHEKVYIYDAQTQDESVRDLKIAKLNDSTPYLYVFQGSKNITKFSYAKSHEKRIFEDTTGEYMFKQIHNFISKPTLYYVGDNYLDERISSKEEKFIVAFIREKCEDCKYVVPNVLIPYINKFRPSSEIYLFDLQSCYDISNSQDATKEEQELYQNTKNKYGLSAETDEKYGYLSGVVPTIQYYENGLLKDATVFFNDIVGEKEDGSFYIADSFYSSERIVNLSYLSNCASTTVLKGMSISDGVLKTKSGALYWSHEAAAIYHTPLLKAFLEYYCK